MWIGARDDTTGKFVAAQKVEAAQNVEVTRKIGATQKFGATRKFGAAHYSKASQGIGATPKAG
jgi:hypothetical protein